MKKYTPLLLILVTGINAHARGTVLRSAVSSLPAVSDTASKEAPGLSSAEQVSLSKLQEALQGAEKVKQEALLAQHAADAEDLHTKLQELKDQDEESKKSAIKEALSQSTKELSAQHQKEADALAEQHAQELDNLKKVHEEEKAQRSSDYMKAAIGLGAGGLLLGKKRSAPISKKVLTASGAALDSPEAFQKMQLGRSLQKAKLPLAQLELQEAHQGAVSALSAKENAASGFLKTLTGKSSTEAIPLLETRYAKLTEPLDAKVRNTKTRVGTLETAIAKAEKDGALKASLEAEKKVAEESLKALEKEKAKITDAIKEAASKIADTGKTLDEAAINTLDRKVIDQAAEHTNILVKNLETEAAEDLAKGKTKIFEQLGGKLKFLAQNKKAAMGAAALGTAGVLYGLKKFFGESGSTTPPPEGRESPLEQPVVTDEVAAEG